MIKPPPNLMENFHKPKDYPQMARGMSFLAFVFSMLIYISVFYIFNLSPYALLNNTKFWFFISNTIILIIAADYGAFSSSKAKIDLYDEYVLRNQTRNIAASFVSQYSEIARESTPKEEAEALLSSENKGEVEERVLEVVQDEPENFIGKTVDVKNCVVPSHEASAKTNVEENVPDDDDGAFEVKSIDLKTLRRSKSDRGRRVNVVKENIKSSLQRSDTEKHHDRPRMEEINEFSTMSDEELNRRVEEFIERFNRQIRLQGARNRRLRNE
ncbi:hypothetical protein SLA2020_326650 [Shorea laevis]